MNYNLFALIIFGFLMAVNWFISVISGDGVVNVNTNNGVIYGQSKAIDGIEVCEFLGIPYAVPPIGELRFKKPVPVGNWSTPINATQLPNPCYQRAQTNPTFLNGNINEDCLYLNIWQPTCNCTNGTKAVLFFIHGGGLIAGSSSEYQFQGQQLCSKGDVVLVTINYRLSVLGFFYAGTEEAPGNVGHWDHILALKWVSDNIGYFCGDSERITICGQSGGSWAVSAHILSPISKPLYNQAILMSGALLTNQVATQSVSLEQWLSGSRILGCANASDTSFNPAIIACMRNINASVLVNMPFMGINAYMSGMPPTTVIDGEFLSDCPYTLLQNGSFKTDINLLIGTVGDEGQVITASRPGYGVTSPANFTYEESRANCTTILSATRYYQPVFDAEQACNLYFAELSPQSTDYDLLRRTTVIPIGDYLLGCTTKVFARSLAKHGSNQTNVYEYHYNSCLGTSVYSCAEWMCPCHGSDLTGLFGLPFIYYSNYTNAQRNESVRMREFFTDFVKFGSPSPQDGIDWPKYYRMNGRVVTPYLKIGTNQWKFGYGLKLTECEYLWKKYMYFSI